MTICTVLGTFILFQVLFRRDLCTMRHCQPIQGLRIQGATVAQPLPPNLSRQWAVILILDVDKPLCTMAASDHESELEGLQLLLTA
jgi:hypothetical protein